MRIIFLLFAIGHSLVIYGQSTIRFQVLDAENNESLPFTTATLSGQSSGFIADIDGYLSIPSLPDDQLLVIKHLGYESQTISLGGLKGISSLKLQPEARKLETLVITAGENPAHPIIRQLVAHKEKLNPASRPHYSMLSKNSFTLGTDHFPETDSQDSAYLRLKNLLSDQYLFSMTSVTRRYFESPDKEKEVVVANRVSGFQNPQFAAMAKSLQNIGFYEDHLEILDILFLNPVSKNSFDNYFFGLEDSLIDESGRKNYVISFEPIKQTFNGLSGTLFIDAEDLAIRHVIAETVRFTEMHDILSTGTPILTAQAKKEYDLYNYLTINFRIQQSYTRIQAGQWFPEEQKADVLLGEFSKIDAPAIPAYIYSKSQFDEISFDETPDSVKFDRVRLEYMPDANSTGINERFPADTLNLSVKEKATLDILDSVFEANQLEKKLAFIQGLALGKLTWKWIDFDLRQSFRFNEYERVRIGLAINTSEKFSRHVELGGNFGYGISDKAYKFGGYGQLNILDKQQLSFRLSYQQDIRQFGSLSFYKYRYFPTDSEVIYPFLIDDMLSFTQYEARLDGYALRYLNGFLSLSTQQVQHPSLASTLDAVPPILSLTEITAGLSYTPGEDLLTFGNAWLPTARSDSYMGLNLTQGLNIIGGNYTYTKVSVLLQKKWQTRSFGVPILTVTGGTAWGDIPSTQLYAIHGSHGRSYIDVANTFRTMGISEFIAGSYLNIFYQHKIFQFTIHPRWSKPHLELHSGWAYGLSQTLDGQSLIQNSAFRYLNDHYLESGLRVRHLVRWSTLSAGFGVAYRYGPYATMSYQDNLALTLDIGFNTGE